MVNVVVKSPYGNQRALPLIFSFLPFIFPFTSYFLLQQCSILPFARVDLKAAFSYFYVAASLLYRRSLPPPVISSLPPFPFFRLSSFYRRIRAGMASLQPCSTFSFHLHNVPRRVLTRESMSLTKFPCTRPRLICSRIYPTCQLQYARSLIMELIFVTCL